MDLDKDLGLGVLDLDGDAMPLDIPGREMIMTDMDLEAVDAIAENDIEGVRQLLYMTDEQLQEYFERNNALMNFATSLGHIEIMRILLDKGCSAEFLDMCGKMTMDYALDADNEEALELLVTHIAEKKEKAYREALQRRQRLEGGGQAGPSS